MTETADKRDFLIPRLVESVERMRTLLRLNAPASIIGAEAFGILATTLAVYGEGAGWALISHLREQNLSGRGVCTYKDCVNYVERPGPSMCPDCEREIGCDPESMAKIDALMAEQDCDGCDGTGLMEGWNRRDGNACPKCKGTGVQP
jgi:hypothetical protein